MLKHGVGELGLLSHVLRHISPRLGRDLWKLSSTDFPLAWDQNVFLRNGT